MHRWVSLTISIAVDPRLRALQALLVVRVLAILRAHAVSGIVGAAGLETRRISLSACTILWMAAAATAATALACPTAAVVVPAVC